MSDEEECDCPPEGAPMWMATFSDMATLMLCFFILLLSFANMDVQNFRTALGSVKEAFGVQFKVKGYFEAMSTSPVELAPKVSGRQLQNEVVVNEESMAIVEEFIRARGLENSLEVSSDPRGVIVRAKDKVLFDSGEARLKDDAIPILIAIGELFKEFSGTLAIEGHTDDRPISTTQFPSNWELSAARSASVLRYMATEDLNLDIVHIAGYADLKPVSPNSTEQGRAVNRRVEFVFEYAEEFAHDPAQAYNVNRLKLDDEKIQQDFREKRRARKLGKGQEENDKLDEEKRGSGAEDDEPDVTASADGGLVDGGLVSDAAVDGGDASDEEDEYDDYYDDYDDDDDDDDEYY